jgi:hypothetical protein
MKNFLVQTYDGEVKHDFCFHLLRAVEYDTWFNGEKRYEVIKVEDKELTNNNEIALIPAVPVGSIEFTFAYLKLKHRNAVFKPINIPSELMKPEFLKRECRRISVGDDPRFEKQNDGTYRLRAGCLFIKSDDEYKGLTGVYGPEASMKPGRYLVSEAVKIDSEWRCFVFKDELVGMNNYAGDFTMFPDVKLIRRMIACINDPDAYTLDVGINKEGTFVIEVHPFVSCGLYGFAEYKYMPQMFIRGYAKLMKEHLLGA